MRLAPTLSTAKGGLNQWGSLCVIQVIQEKGKAASAEAHCLSHPSPGQSRGSKYGRAEHANTQVTPVYQKRSGVEPDHPLLPVAGGDPLTAQVAMQDQSRGGTVGGVQPGTKLAVRATNRTPLRPRCCANYGGFLCASHHSPTMHCSWDGREEDDRQPRGQPINSGGDMGALHGLNTNPGAGLWGFCNHQRGQRDTSNPEATQSGRSTIYSWMCPGAPAPAVQPE